MPWHVIWLIYALWCSIVCYTVVRAHSKNSIDIMLIHTRTQNSDSPLHASAYIQDGALILHLCGGLVRPKCQRLLLRTHTQVVGKMKCLLFNIYVYMVHGGIQVVQHNVWDRFYETFPSWFLCCTCDSAASHFMYATNSHADGIFKIYSEKGGNQVKGFFFPIISDITNVLCCPHLED